MKVPLTPTQSEQVMSDLKRTTDELRDGYVRIKLLSEQMVDKFPDDENARETLTWVNKILDKPQR